MKIISKDIWIICPKSNVKHDIHDCILNDCKYEAGHVITHMGWVNCMFGESKQSKLNLGGDGK